MYNSIELDFISQSQCPMCRCDDIKFFDMSLDRLTQEINRYIPSGLDKLPEITNTRSQCKNCHLVFLSPRLSDQSLSIIYNLWYRYGFRVVFDDDLYIAQRVKEFECYHLQMLNKYASGTGRLLDVGCGTGIFLQVAQNAGWQGTGIESDVSAAEGGKSQFSLDIRTGVLGNALRSQEGFDAITMFDYLEHSTKPIEDLKIAVKRLNPGGILLIRVPNQDGWQSRVMGKHWIAVISNHLIYFTPAVLAKHLEKFDLEIVSITASNYQTQGDIWRRRARWLYNRLQSISSVESSQSLSKYPIPRGGSIRNLVRLSSDLFVEQLDYLAGFVGKSNYLMITARKVLN